MPASFPRPIRAAAKGVFYIFTLTLTFVLLISLTEPLLNPLFGINNASSNHNSRNTYTYSSSKESSTTQRAPRPGSARAWAPLTHYEILDVPLDVDDAALRRRYLRRARSYHPDKVHHLGPAARAAAEARFDELRTSYEFLLLSDRRCAYDRVFLRPTAQQRAGCLERQIERRARRRREELEDRQRAVRAEEEARVKAEEEEREAAFAEVEGWMMNRGGGGGGGGDDDDDDGKGNGGERKKKEKSVCDNELMIYPLNTLCRFIVDGSVGLFSWLRGALHIVALKGVGKLIPGIW